MIGRRGVRFARVFHAALMVVIVAAACGPGSEYDIYVSSSLGPWDAVEDGRYAVGSRVRLRFDAEEGLDVLR